MTDRHHVARRLFLLVLGVGALAVLAGCQSANSAAAAKADRLCPNCPRI